MRKIDGRGPLDGYGRGWASFPTGVPQKIVTIAAQMGSDDDDDHWLAASGTPTWRALGGAPPTDHRCWYYKFSAALPNALGQLISAKLTVAIELVSRSLIDAVVTLSAIRTNFTPVDGQAIGALTLQALDAKTLSIQGATGMSTLVPGTVEMYLGNGANSILGPYYGLKLALSSLATDGSIKLIASPPAISYVFGS
jgi:hypothetical protein